MILERIDRIYKELEKPEFQISLAENPIQQGPGYVSSMVSRISHAIERLNKLYEEAVKAESDNAIELSDLKEEVKFKVQAMRLTLSQQETEGLNSKAKEAFALMKVEDIHQREEKQLLASQGKPVPEKVLTLQEQIRICENAKTSLKALLTILLNKKKQFARQDSGVRLQCQAVEAEIKLYGPAPTGKRPTTGETLKTHEKADDSLSARRVTNLVESDAFKDMTESTHIN